MARDSTISYEQVANTARDIKERGGKPTSRAVRDALGSGSMATVCKFLQQWQGEQVEKNNSPDDPLDPAVVRAINNQIAARVRDASASLTTQLADLQADAAAIIADNERQAAEIVALNSDLIILREQCAAYTGRLMQLESEAERAVADLNAERKNSESVRIALARAELRLEAVPRQEAEIATLRAELLQFQKQVAEQHEAAAVATALLQQFQSRSV